MTRDELYSEAKRLAIPGRSKMSKADLVLAVKDAEQGHAFSGHLSNSQRVLNYQKQNGSSRLTARQARRVRKNANKHETVS